MFRFTIRDLLWLMVVVGMGICLYQDSVQRRRLELRVRQGDAELRKLDFRNGHLRETVAQQKLALERMPENSSQVTRSRP